MSEMSYEARRFVDFLKRGIIRKNILPNSAEDYSLSQEKKDLDRYVGFLQSFAYDAIFDCEVKQYDGD